MNRERLNIWLLAVLACFLWSTAFAGIKIALRYSTPLMLGGIRFFLAGILLIPFSGRLRDYGRNIKKYYRIILKISVFQTFIAYGFFMIGISIVPAYIGAIVVGSSPLITAVGSHFLLKNDKINVRKLAAVFAGIAGIVLIAVSRNPVTKTGQKELIGIGILFCGLLASAMGNISVYKDKGEINPVFLNSVQIGIGGVLLLLLSVPFKQFKPINLTLEFIAALLWLSFLSAAAFSIWFYLLKVKGTKVSELNLWKFIVPVSGAVLSWIILPGENPDIFSIAGMIIVALSIIFYFFGRPVQENTDG
ncbi:MAG: hypothetical protein DRP57_07530 [Spirochaetes bacterium]|nr:MAG: hypothetical protein DRP57_07530 [Spirochaetota bacterium]